MRYTHTNIIAKDWRAVSLFYQKVFGCVPVPPQRDLHGEWLEKLTGIAGVQITGEHLRLPGYGEEGPTLEIFSYNNSIACPKQLNRHGLAHIAFEVADVRGRLALLLEEGGSLIGEVVSKQYLGLGTGTFAYARDIEGNIIELQSWEKELIHENGDR